MTPDQVSKTLEMSGIKESEGVVTELAQFRNALSAAQLAKKTYLEVSEEIFTFLANGEVTNYINYGTPTIRIFRPGTKEEIERRERMNIDALAKLQADEWRAANPDKINEAQW